MIMCEYLKGNTCQIDKDYCEIPKHYACQKRVNHKSQTEATENPPRCPGRKDDFHNNTMNILGYFLYKDTGEPCCYLCYVNAKLDHLRPWYNDNFHSPHTAMCIMEASQLDSSKRSSK